jgi:hypothetical protein
MPSPFPQTKAEKYAPLFTRKFKTGLFTNGNPLGDPVTQYMTERFYGPTLYDYLIDGHDAEITAALTLRRRPGHSVYNSQSFPAIDNFYEFRTFTTNTERIYVMASSAANIYDATGPSTKNAIYAKAGGASKAFFQDVGNVLYWGDGVNPKKWLPALSSFDTYGFLVGPITWTALTVLGVKQLVIDTNGNIQVSIAGGTTGASQPAWNVTPFGTTTDAGVTWRNHGPLVMNWGVTAPAAAPTVVAPTSPDIFACRFWMPNHTYGAGASGTYVVFDGIQGRMKLLVDGTKTTGTTYPAWSLNAGGAGTAGTQGITQDGTAQWIDLGNLFSIAQYVALGNGAAGQLLAKTVTIIDANNNIQTVTIGGNTGAQIQTVAFNATPGGTTVDGGVTWTCCGNANICVQRGYTYYSAYFSASRQFSNLSPAAQPTGAVMGVTYSATIGGNGSSDAQVIQNVVFRTVDGGTIPFAKITDGSSVENANIAWTLTDTTADRLLDTNTIGETTLRNSPPPAGLINLTFHLGRLWGSVGNLVYVSNPANLTIGIGWESFQPINFYTHPSQVVRIEPTAIGMLIFTVSDVYIIPINPLTGALSVASIPYIKGTGLLSWNAFTVNGSVMYILSTSGNLLGLDPSNGVTWAGHPIADKLKVFSRSGSYLTWHEDGEDIGLYVFDGVNQRYRLASTAAPESSTPPWSPVCNLASSAVMSVEVLPGVTKLLLGPASNGPILQRDSSVNTDNGALFSWNVTIGTLILAHPGQLAEVAFLTTICRKIGSHPTLGLLVDEISGTFKFLTANTQDSPFKFASSTLMMDRFNTNQMNDPAKMMFLQIQLGFPAENIRNEILAYSIFGAHYQEM